MRKQLCAQLEKRIEQFISQTRSSLEQNDKMLKKQAALQKRDAELVKVKAIGKIKNIETKQDELQKVKYEVQLQYFIKQQNHFYIEEELEVREAEFYKDVLVHDQELPLFLPGETSLRVEEWKESDERVVFRYNRLKAVQYAERWWNDYNPAFKKFDVDCTNFISQCLHAGGAPMTGYPNRNQGWWMRNNSWSFSWTVAHSFRWYLQNSKSGLRAREVRSVSELLLGDVICYDFQGNGRFDHSTIVTAKDAAGMPLVNAHTTNSRMRYWSYEDSTAYTPNIQYKFFTIVDD